MKIGIIVSPNTKNRKTTTHHCAYYLSGLLKCKEITEVYCNEIPESNYNFFKIEHENLKILPKKEIEKMNLDFIIYNYYSIEFDKIRPQTINKKIIMDISDIMYVQKTKHWKAAYDRANIILKISTPKDRDLLLKHGTRPKLWREYYTTLSNAKKINPLFYVGSYSLDYHYHIFMNIHKLSFLGSPTSVDRIEAYNKLKEKYNTDFYSAFIMDTREEICVDEDGSKPYLISDVLIEPEKWVTKIPLLNLTRRSTISFVPPGWGRNTHRFIDTMAMGGCSLVGDISCIDFGIFEPEDGTHYLSYKRDHSDLIDKAEYLINNQTKAETIGNNARLFMKNTYFDNENMARKYILEKL